MAEAKEADNTYGADNDCILMFSGGPDSTTLLKKLQGEGKKVAPLYIITGGPGSRNDMDSEAANAKKLAKDNGTELETWNLSQVTSKFPPNQVMCIHVGNKYIPFCGATMYSAVAGLAISRGIKEVYFAYHKEDAEEAVMYNKEFLKQTNALIKLAYPENGVQIIAPFHDMTKLEVIQQGQKLGVDFSSTWSCSNPKFMKKRQCGKCGSCKARKLNFTKAAITDKTLYQE